MFTIGWKTTRKPRSLSRRATGPVPAPTPYPSSPSSTVASVTVDP